MMNAPRLTVILLFTLCASIAGPLGTGVAVALPDGRVYEMVTPAANQNADVYSPNAGPLESAKGTMVNTRLPFQASLDGDAVTYLGDSTIGGNGNTGKGLGNQYLATRSPNGGWIQVNITPPSSINAFLATTYYEAFSSDLSIAILSTAEPEPLSPESPVGDYSLLYARSSSDGVYHPLITVTPPHRAARGQGEFETANGFGPGEDDNELLFAGASADGKHQLFEANDALTVKAEESPPTAEQNDLYDSESGRLQAVNVLPDGSITPGATFGSPPLSFGNPHQEPPALSHVISADGSRIVWTDLNTADLYLREDIDTPQARTVQVDASQGSGVGGGGRFWTASSDGSAIFITDDASAGLTSNTALGSGANLYVFDTNMGKLVNLAPSSEADVQGVVGASEDGSYVYFVANGALASGAAAGQPNLYLLHDNGGEWERPRFIVTLSPEDDELPQSLGNPNAEAVVGDWQPGVGTRTAEVTPNGRHLVFASVRALTTYPGEGHEEVFTYSADSGRLECASCDPGGVPPTVAAKERNNVASTLPVSWGAIRQQRWISDDGDRVFFDSVEPLVPQDINEKADVYEWERDGAGTCQRDAGCIYLLSSGTGEESLFIDASANGDDVFLVTRAQLVLEDQNENLDLYDARVDGIEPLVPPQCSGTGCQGLPLAPPIFATPSSVTFNGVGNFAPQAASPTVKVKVKPKSCKRGFVKRRGRCVRKRAEKRRTTKAKNTARGRK